jgi:hypothetical protein
VAMAVTKDCWSLKRGSFRSPSPGTRARSFRPGFSAGSQRPVAVRP